MLKIKQGIINFEEVHRNNYTVITLFTDKTKIYLK